MQTPCRLDAPAKCVNHVANHVPTLVLLSVPINHTFIIIFPAVTLGQIEKSRISLPACSTVHINIIFWGVHFPKHSPRDFAGSVYYYVSLPGCNGRFLPATVDGAWLSICVDLRGNGGTDCRPSVQKFYPVSM